jgi:hypothetical protein
MAEKQLSGKQEDEAHEEELRGYVSDFGSRDMRWCIRLPNTS